MLCHSGYAKAKLAEKIGNLLKGAIEIKVSDENVSNMGRSPFSRG
jgi:hypothetical protein